MRKILIALFICFSFLEADAQTLKDVFKTMPRGIIYGLNKDLNEILLENPKDTSKFVATAIYDEIKRQDINSEFIALRTSSAGTTAIKLFSLINGSKIICVIRTVCGTICDSRIVFYTDKWEEIDSTSLMPARDIKWFLKNGADAKDEKFEHALLALNMAPMKYILSADEDIITIEFDVKSFLSIEDYKIVESFLTKKTKVLRWDKSSFR